MLVFRTAALLQALALSGSALAEPPPPARPVPDSVNAELRDVERRFELALAQDCDAERCFPKGCYYVDHSVTGRSAAGAMPGLGLGVEASQGAEPPQVFLTQARCAFAYEESADPKDISALTRRLGTKLSVGWTAVSVESQRLAELPAYMTQRPVPAAEEPPPPPPPVEAPPEPWMSQLWSALLPHFYWMIGLGLATLAAAAIIWSWRRLGRETMEERLLLAELAQPALEPEPAAEVAQAAPAPAPDAYVADQEAIWSARFAAFDPEDPDPELRSLLSALLRDGALPLLAKATLRYPDSLHRALPVGGEVAAAKLALADYLQTVSEDALPSDEAFFRDLNRRSLAAAIDSQADARIVRSLREDFGAFGLVTLIGGLPARAGGLLFALAPSEEQREMLPLLADARLNGLIDGLMRSNRMDAREADHLFQVLAAARASQPLPAPLDGDVSDRGAVFDAPRALSLLLERVPSARRADVLRPTLARFHGKLPSWHRGVLVSDMLFALPDEERADLLLDIDARALAAWLSLLDPSTTERLLASAPAALRRSTQAASSFASRADQLALADAGHRALAAGFQRQLARLRLNFEAVLLPQTAA